MNDYQPRWFLRTISYKQTHLAPVNYKDSSLKLLFTFKVWARLFADVFIFLFSYFSTYCMNVYHAIPDDIKRFQQAELQHYIIQTGNLKFSSGNFISPVGHQKATWWFF